MTEAHNSNGPSAKPGPRGPVVIEPGTAAYAILRLAIANGQKVSIDPRGGGRFAIKRGEYMWTATLEGGDSAAPFSEHGKGPFRQSEAPPNT